ncbi:MAG: class I SAM-dependent methyltransferase [Herminiimonas sp.]|nr:class I SAM-dependent methyltransferase [Herminiimonas sp.]
MSDLGNQIGNIERRRLFEMPAVRALVTQIVSFLVVAGLTTVLNVSAQVFVPLLPSAVVQGVIAAGLSHRIGLAPWWIGIELLFPVAAVAMQALGIPPSVYFIAFVFFLGLYWSTFRTQVPYYPSRRSVRRAVAGLLPSGRGVSFIDIGSGLGGLTLDLARHRPDGTFIGIELAPLPWLISMLRARVSRSPARFMRGDYADLDFSQYDVVFAYLSPVAMPALWQQAKAEMCPGSLLLSYEFPIAGEKWNIIKTPEDGGPDLYGWRI